RNNPEEINELLNTILINVTGFFRDPPAWEILRHEILPPLLKPLKTGHSFRVWSAGCASGEEAYSAAILLAEHFGPHIQEYDVKIYATDIDEDALNTARRGEYSLDSVQRVRPEWQGKYFHGEGLLRINRDVRRLVIFGRSNLGQDAPISHVNLLICRNLLIYFDSDLQKQILKKSTSFSTPSSSMRSIQVAFCFWESPNRSWPGHRNSAGLTRAGEFFSGLQTRRLPMSSRSQGETIIPKRIIIESRWGLPHRQTTKWCVASSVICWRCSALESSSLTLTTG
ncbi:MAG: hypothetical protein DMG97_01045, partial [Acidobacteria bacterium]